VSALVAPGARQRDAILAHLHSMDGSGQRRGLTQMEALGLYRVNRLASRIDELRQDGYDIHSIWRRDTTGKRYVRYFLL